jgi:trimethyllysine dioxygenase
MWRLALSSLRLARLPVPQLSGASFSVSGARCGSPPVQIRAADIVVGSSSWNSLWLRDNCRCPACWHPETKQRQLDTLRLLEKPTLYHPLRVEVRGTDSLHVQWQDAHESVYSLAWLRQTYGLHAERPKRFIWQAADFSTPAEATGTPLPQIDLASFTQDQHAAVFEWVSLLQRYGFVIINGVAPQVETMRQVIESIAPLFNSMFGDVWDISQVDTSAEWNAEHRDTAYSNGPIGPHTDGCYSWSPPGVQFFQIATTAVQGGANYFVDGFKLAQRLQRDHPESFKLLSTVPIAYHYDDDTLGNHLVATHRIFSLDATGECYRCHFNDSDRLPFQCPPEQIVPFYQAYGHLLALLEAPAFHLRLQLRPDQLLATDNWRVLHAREGFSGHRRLMGGYIERDTYTRRVIDSNSSAHVGGKRTCSLSEKTDAAHTAAP